MLVKPNIFKLCLLTLASITLLCCVQVSNARADAAARQEKIYKQYLHAAAKHWKKPNSPEIKIMLGSFQEPLDMSGLARADGYNIILNPAWWGLLPIKDRMSWPMFIDPWMGCAVIVHEIGHTHGKQHVSNPKNIMNDTGLENAVVPACNPWTWKNRHKQWLKDHPKKNTKSWKREHKKWHDEND